MKIILDCIEIKDQIGEYFVEIYGYEGYSSLNKEQAFNLTQQILNNQAIVEKIKERVKEEGDEEHLCYLHGEFIIELKEIIQEVTSLTKMKDGMCGYCGINLERNQGHDVDKCKYYNDQCRYCKKYLIPAMGLFEIDPNYGAFCSIECMEKQHKK